MLGALAGLEQINFLRRPPMEMKEVESSQIHSIGHDPKTNTLAILFKGVGGPGNLYHYPNFTAEQFKAFQGCKSHGKFFHANIKGKKEHPHTKIDEKKE